MNAIESNIRTFVVFGLMLLAISIRYLVLYLKINKDERKGNKRARDCIGYFILGMVGVTLAIWSISKSSIDLIKQDYIVEQGIYLDSVRSSFNYDIAFQCGDGKKTLIGYSRYGEEFVEGELYEFTYGKRSNIIIECKPVRGAIANDTG